MTLVALALDRVAQPSEGAQLARNGVVRAPKLLAIPSLARAVAGGGSRSIVSAYDIGPRAPVGVAARGPATILPGYVSYDFAYPMDVSGDFSLMLYCAAYSTLGTLFPCAIYEGTGGLASGGSFWVDSANALVAMDSAGTSQVSGNYTRPTVFVAVRSGSTETLYINGVASATVSSYAHTGAISAFVFGRDRGSNNAAEVSHWAMGGWNVALTIDEVRAVSSNPWVLIEPEQNVVPFASASGGTTVDVPAGALTLTGYAPTVNTTANQTIAVPAGALTLAGLVPTIVTSGNQSVSVPAGSLTLTGYAPTVTVGGAASIDVPLGTVALTGYAPTVTTGGQAQIDVPLGTVTLTGYVPTVTTTEHVYIAVPTAAMTLAAYAPTVTTSGTPDTWTPVSASTGTWTPQ